MAIDVKQLVPAWVGYADYVGGGSDKFYEVRVDEDTPGNWLVTKRFGRNPDDGTGGQVHQERHVNRQAAEANAVKVYDSKLGKGYDPRPWPHGAAAMPDFQNPEAVERWLAT